MSQPNTTRERLDIRKYPNRRYYDATHSRHLTLEEIRSLIREGHDITVTDSKSGADITGQVLTQIILELETPKIDSFPVALLTRLIRSNDQMVRDFVEKYLSQAFGAYLEYQKQMEERLRQMPGMSAFFPPFGAWAQAMSSPPAEHSGETRSPSKKPPTPPASAGDEKADLREVVAGLQEQLAGLKEQLDARKKPRRRKR
jgi:polyhydroxyalkanoate synthesis repressor PhaR